MDFHSLSRRELQAICKRNKIPANVTNAAMADSLKALEIVEGIDEVLEACKSEIAQSSIERLVRLEVTSPYVPPTGSRSTVMKIAAEKMDSMSTPAPSGVTSRRRRAAKEDSAVKQVNGTRRSARLAEKSAKLLIRVGNENTDLSKKDLFAGDGQEELKMNLKESLDGLDEMSGVTGMEESKIKDEVQVDTADKQVVSTDEGVDANTSVEMNFEEEHHFTVDDDKTELNESKVAENEQVGFDSETEEFGNDEIRALALKNLNNEAQETEGSDACQNSETKMTRIKVEKIAEENTAEDSESVDEVVTENKADSSETAADSLACLPSEINLLSDEDDAFDLDVVPEIDDPLPTKQDVAVDDPLPTKLDEAKQSFTIHLTSTPMKVYARKGSALSRIRTTAASDNKENIGSGSKTAPAKERSKIFKQIAETVPMLDDSSLMQLSKNLKELSITQNLEKNESDNEVYTRTALQALPENHKGKLNLKTI